MILIPGDVVLTRSLSCIGRLILYFERSRGEEKSVVEHTGVIGESGNRISASIIESLSSTCLNESSPY